MPTQDHTYPPRGLSRADAARWIGVGPTTFDEMVADGRMPRPKRINARTVWDRYEIDQAFAQLPSERPAMENFLSRHPRKD